MPRSMLLMYDEVNTAADSAASYLVENSDGTLWVDYTTVSYQFQDILFSNFV